MDCHQDRPSGWHFQRCCRNLSCIWQPRHSSWRYWLRAQSDISFFIHSAYTRQASISSSAHLLVLITPFRMYNLFEIQANRYPDVLLEFTDSHCLLLAPRGFATFSISNKNLPPPLKANRLPIGQVVEILKPIVFVRVTHKARIFYCHRGSKTESFSLDGPLVLKDLSFDIKSGERIGIGRFHHYLSFCTPH